MHSEMKLYKIEFYEPIKSMWKAPFSHHKNKNLFKMNTSLWSIHIGGFFMASKEYKVIAKNKILRARKY